MTSAVRVECAGCDVDQKEYDRLKELNQWMLEIEERYRQQRIVDQWVGIGWCVIFGSMVLASFLGAMFMLVSLLKEIF